ncbi:MAG TPA: hypothetical protein VGZ90_06630 [Puia sp.]|jgi:hypothetical protein|nr:hypothetical protein [Puia sp.]
MKIKTESEFKNSLLLNEPPAGLSLYEKALWYSGKGDWEKAHNIVQDMNDKSSALIHGFLHRQEGDHSNARYWYDRAGSRMPSISLDEEWEELITKFLADQTFRF